MGHLVEQYRDCGDDPDALSSEEGGTDGQSVGEVVCEIGNQVEVAGHFDVAGVGLLGRRAG